MSRCIAAEEFEVYGNYDKENTQLIHIDIVKCTDRDDCKTDEEEIYNYFARMQMSLLKN